MRRTLRLLALAALAAVPALRPAQAQSDAEAAAAPSTPDKLLQRTYQRLLRDEVRQARFRIVALSSEEEGALDTVSGRVYSYSPPPEGLYRYRVEFNDPSQPVLAFDGSALQHRYARHRRIYVDSSAASLSSTNAAALSMHPMLSVLMHRLHEAAKTKTHLGAGRVDGRACQRTRIVAPREEGEDLQVNACYDGLTGLPHQLAFDVEGTSLDITLSDVTFTPGPPADTTFTLRLPEGGVYRAYDGSDRPALLAAGQPAPDFTVTDSDGAAVRLSDLRGRIVLLDFWGTWCGPCLAEIPALQALADSHPDLVVLGLASFEEPDADPAAVARERGARYRIARASDATAEAYSVEAVPAYVIVGRDGTVVFSALHDDDETALERAGALIRTLLAR